MGIRNYISNFWRFRFSRMKDKKDEALKEEQIRRYEQHVEKYGMYGAPYDDEEDLRRNHLKCWQFLLYDMRSRVVLTILLACGIGILVPALFFIITAPGDNRLDNFGSCDVNVAWRFKNEINQVEDTYLDLKNCSKEANACWENDDTLQFKCYHSVPSSFAYYLDGPATICYPNDPNNNKNDENISQTKSRNSSRSYESPLSGGKVIELNLIPMENKYQWNGKNPLMNMKSSISWESTEVLNIQFTNKEASKKENRNNCTDDFNGTGDQNSKEEKEFNGDKELQVHIAETDKSFFYIQIGRDLNTTDDVETIFDTRIGPLRMAKINESTIFTVATTLPTKYFYGIQGGQGIDVLGSTMVDGVNSFGRNELPFYMVYEKTGFVHGVLFETSSPFVAQVTQGPGVLFHFESLKEEISVNLKLFVGPRPTDVARQFYTYMVKNTGREFPLIPYWGLGLHLCRNTTTGNQTMKDISELTSFPYDSDCISQNLRTPFEIDKKAFGNLEDIRDKLKSKSRRIVLTQKLSIKIPHNTKNDRMFIKNETSDEPYIGAVNKQKVNYFSVFNDEAVQYMRDNFKKENLTFERDFDGLVLIENLPRHDNATVEYQMIRNTTSFKNSRIQSLFSSSEDVWGTVSPKSRHLTNSKGTNETTNMFHLDLVNIYGQESLKVFNDIVKPRNLNGTTGNGTEQLNSTRKLITSSSIWTESFLYGGFNGLDLPFTWSGLRSGLSHILRYFLFTPFSGLPACGTHQLNESIPFDQELCLRWFQVSLLLPFARSTYGNSNKNSSRGPLDFNKAYQNHLIENIKNRYAYTPYYYTLMYEYTKTGVPAILPISFHHFGDMGTSGRNAFTILDQLLIGPALMATPILNPGTSRTVFFPNGTWYKLVDGELVWDNEVNSGILTVAALINYVPIFIQGGHIISTLTNPSVTTESSRIGNYTIIATYPKTDKSSHGTLYVDDGNSTLPTETYEITFHLSQTKFSMTTKAKGINCELGQKISTTISDLKIFGFPKRPPYIFSSAANGNLPVSSILYDDEVHVLRLKLLNINWCKNPNVNLSWNLDRVLKDNGER